MDVKHAAARKSFELAFSGVYKYINKNKEENLVKLMNLAHKIAGKNFPQYFWDNANEVLGDPEQKWTQMIYNAMDRLHPNIVKQHVLNMGLKLA